MGRSESTAAAKQGMGQSAEEQANARSALASTNAGLASYNKRLGDFMSFGRRIYGEGGDYAQTQNTLANTTAAAGTNKLKGDLALNAMRTGENTGNYAATTAESQRESSRDLTNQLAGANADRLSKLTGLEQYGVEGEKVAPAIQAGLYGTGSGASSSQLGHAAEAAKTPGFWDQFAPALVGGGAAVGSAAIKACWIAATVYDGWLDPRTVLVREWLSTEFIKRPVGRLVMALYVRFGRQIAALVRTRPLLRRQVKRLFDIALAKAKAWRQANAA